MSAPCSRSRRTTSRRPRNAAAMSAVFPAGVLALIVAPRSRSTFATSRSPRSAARIKAVWPVPSLVSGDTPRSRIILTRSRLPAAAASSRDSGSPASRGRTKPAVAARVITASTTPTVTVREGKPRRRVGVLLMRAILLLCARSRGSSLLTPGTGPRFRRTAGGPRAPGQRGRATRSVLLGSKRPVRVSAHSTRQAPRVARSQ